MDKEGREFAFLQEKFPRISIEKLKDGIFDGLQIRELIKNPIFEKAVSEAEMSAWQSLILVVTNFQWNHRFAEYEKTIEEPLKS